MPEAAAIEPALERAQQQFIDQVPADRFCDLVLTGGVTSGVIYPSAVVQLARRYRFKSIGGTSAGAMAAALTAAAEYLRYQGSAAGFVALRSVPARLAEKVGNQTRLLSLFQPAQQTRRLFGLFTGMLNQSEAGSGQKWFAALIVALVKNYWWALIIPLILGTLLAYEMSPRWLAILVGIGAFVSAGAVCIAHRIYIDLTLGLVGNGFGICSGKGTDPEKPALIDWLHSSIQQLVGMRENEPLTFQHLCNAGKLPEFLQGTDCASQPLINLQMITTNLTHGRPYKFPLDEHSERLFFKASEWRRYFPSTVVDFLVNVSHPYKRKNESEPAEDAETQLLRELPSRDLPIVVAARLSLSFPLIFSAIPVWAIDFEPPVRGNQHQRKLRRCWFSDGGICSNFPIHLFDSFLPKWPTFGISLGRRSPFRSKNESICLPKYHNQGRADTWNRFGDERLVTDESVRRSPLQRLAGFAECLVLTAKDWNDNAELRMPGVRDRVARVGFAANEGGLNIKLSSDEIKRLARRYGRVAGIKLANTFTSEKPDRPIALAWRDHRWVRFNALLQSLRERVTMLALAIEATPHTQSIRQQIAQAFVIRPLRGNRKEEAPLTATQADSLDGLLQALIELELKFKEFAAQQPYSAVPPPSLRNRPPL